MARIAHLSDLHFGEADAGQAESLAEDIRQQAPEAVIVSGDLTRRALAAEFAAATAFLDGLGAPLLVVPGNHDIPRFDLLARFLHPRSRWIGARPGGFPPTLELDGLRVLGLDSVSRAQWHLDWAAGGIPARRRAALSLALSKPFDGMTLVAGHHPLRHPHWAGARRPPRHAGGVIDLLRAAGVSAILCGHLHRAAISRIDGNGPLQVVAPSALSPRGEATRNGWNLITADAGQVCVTLREWSGGQWVPRGLTEEPARSVPSSLQAI